MTQSGHFVSPMLIGRKGAPVASGGAGPPIDVARHVGLRRAVNRESPARELTDTAVVEAIHAALPD